MNFEIEERLPEWLVTCLRTADGCVPERGVPLSPEDEAAGLAAALAFVNSLQIPDDPRQSAALFPRLWVLHCFVHSALASDAAPWRDADTKAFLRLILAAGWEISGRPLWETPPADSDVFP